MKAVLFLWLIFANVTFLSSIVQADSGKFSENNILEQTDSLEQQNSNMLQKESSSTVIKKSANAIPSGVKDDQLRTASSPALSKSASPLSELPTVVLTLFLLIVGIFTLAWLARKYGTFGLTKGNRIEVKSSIPVGSRERVSLIVVDGQKLLIGVTGQQVSLLHTFDGIDDEQLVTSNSLDANSSQQTKSLFAEKLKAAMQKGAIGGNSDRVTNIEKRVE